MVFTSSTLCSTSTLVVYAVYVQIRVITFYHMVVIAIPSCLKIGSLSVDFLQLCLGCFELSFFTPLGYLVQKRADCLPVWVCAVSHSCHPLLYLGERGE